MIRVDSISNSTFENVPVDPFWNTGDSKELKMHRIHSYPAKFPAFLTTKALAFAKQNNLEINMIADVFCGCGTVAYESKRNNINFWGCDINPVATMIAKAKSKKYQPSRLQRYYESILEYYNENRQVLVSYDDANERLKYWYDVTKYNDLFRLKYAIENTISSNSEYKLFFTCAFSNILKATSRWLTKSIKPQVDPDKIPADVIMAFQRQYDFMYSANIQNDLSSNASVEIANTNILSPTINNPKVDMIITSPPYVTSYEYADLHQLSSLWLGYADDYRDLRNGSIGSCQHSYNFERELKRLNTTGSKIVFRLYDQYKAKAKSVAKYFLDMQQVATKCHAMLNDNGMALFVIGNTEYKNVKIDNAQHLAESLYASGFSDVLVTKRKISKKILTPYRDKRGCFTTDSNGRKVYSEEFILVGRKK